MKPLYSKSSVFMKSILTNKHYTPAYIFKLSKSDNTGHIDQIQDLHIES